MKQPVLFGSSGGGSWIYTIVVSAPLGASINVSGGGETQTATATGQYQAFYVHKASTVYTISATMDGQAKTSTVTTGAISGGISFVSFEFGTINLTVANDFIGESITCVNGGTTITKTAVSTSVVFNVPTTGTWVISGTVSGQTYSVNAVVSDLSVPVSATLETVPDGSTVLPTDDVQIWLNCAGIYDKTSYTTLADVLADHDTLQKVISNENATDYLVRSKTWASAQNLIPQATSTTTEAICSSNYSGSPAYYAFDRDFSTAWGSNTTNSGEWIGYDFGSPVVVNKIVAISSHNAATLSVKFQGYDGSNWIDIDTFSWVYSDGSTKYTFAENINNTTAYSKYRLYKNSASGTAGRFWITELAMYNKTDAIITEDATAMRYIGKRNYAANTLLADEDWYDAIQSSDYYESVTGSQVPIMTDDTHPSGEVVYSTLYSGNQAYWAFDGNVSTVVNIQNQVGSYIGYIFDHPVLLTRIFVDHQGSNHSTGFKLQYTDDGTNWSDLDVSWTVNATTSAEVLIPYSTTKHLGYRVMETVKSATWNWMPFASITFYGRSDVSEDYIDIYSAASDTVYYLDNGSPVTVCTTDTSGHGTVSRSSLPVGTYTLYSTVADNPSNLSADYSKSIDVESYSIEFWLMPDKTLYWYGYLSDDAEEMIAANGWTYPSYTYVSPTYNTNDILISSTNSKICGISTKTINVTTGDKVNAIAEGVTIGSGVYGWIQMTSSKTSTASTTLVGADITSNSKAAYQAVISSGNWFPCMQTSNARTHKLYAFWLE